MLKELGLCASFLCVALSDMGKHRMEAARKQQLRGCKSRGEEPTVSEMHTETCVPAFIVDSCAPCVVRMRIYAYDV